MKTVQMTISPKALQETVVRTDQDRRLRLGMSKFARKLVSSSIGKSCRRSVRPRLVGCRCKKAD